MNKIIFLFFIFFISSCKPGKNDSNKEIVNPPINAISALTVVQSNPLGVSYVSSDIQFIEVEFNFPINENTIIIGSDRDINSINIYQNNSSEELIEIYDYSLFNNKKSIKLSLNEYLLDGESYTLEITRYVEGINGEKLLKTFKNSFNAKYSFKQLTIDTYHSSSEIVEHSNLSLSFNKYFQISKIYPNLIKILDENGQRMSSSLFKFEVKDQTLQILPENNNLFLANSSMGSNYSIEFEDGALTDLAGYPIEKFVYNFKVIKKPEVKQEYSIPTLVLLLSFQNHEFKVPERLIANRIFGHQEKNLNHFVYMNSHGKHDLIPVEEIDGNINDGVISINLEFDHPLNEKDQNQKDILMEALHTARLKGVDFPKYDKNNNGIIERHEMTIFFIYAGGNLAVGDNEAFSVHPHSSCISKYYNNDQVFRIDGVELVNCESDNRYSIVSEFENSIPTTIGVMAHELGHTWLKLKDYYDMDDSSYGTGSYSLMSYGIFAREFYGADRGDVPIGLDAYSKIAAKFHEDNDNLTLITNPRNQSFLSLTPSSQLQTNILKLSSIYNNNESFFIENRSPINYDKGFKYLLRNSSFKGGLLIWHVDTSINSNRNEDHKFIDVEEATGDELDERYSLHDIDDFFGEYSGNRNFVPLSHYLYEDRGDNPSSDFYEDYYTTGVGIYNIEDYNTQNNTIKFQILNESY